MGGWDLISYTPSDPVTSLPSYTAFVVTLSTSHEVDLDAPDAPDAAAESPKRLSAPPSSRYPFPEAI